MGADWLTDEELLALWQGGENDRVEFKESLQAETKTRRAICAFANDLPNHQLPGVVFIGIRKDKSYKQTTIDDAALLRMREYVQDVILPVPAYLAQKRILNGCEVGVIQVKPSSFKPVRFDQTIYVSNASSRDRASRDQEILLESRSERRTFDRVGLQGSSIEQDIDIDRLLHGIWPGVVDAETLSENDRPINLKLRLHGLADRNNLPTPCGLLYCGRNPRDWLPGAYIAFTRFSGSDDASPIVSLQDLDGTIPDLVRQGEELFKLHNQVGVTIGTFQDIHSTDYPLPALKETLVNALIHRDYQNSTAPVRIEWYEDRIEIISPGRPLIADSELGQVTDYRNPGIADMAGHLRLGLKRGQGIRLIRQGCRDNGNPPPEFKSSERAFVVLVRKKP